VVLHWWGKKELSPTEQDRQSFTDVGASMTQGPHLHAHEPRLIGADLIKKGGSSLMVDQIAEMDDLDETQIHEKAQKFIQKYQIKRQQRQNVEMAEVMNDYKQLAGGIVGNFAQRRDFSKDDMKKRKSQVSFDDEITSKIALNSASELA